MWLLLQITVFSKYNEDPKCYMFLESSQKMLIEYHYDNVQIHGHGHEHVHLSIGLTPSVVCLWNRHRKCWWNKTLAMPISISMVMVTSIFECFRSCWSWFLGPKGLLRLVEVRKKVVHRSIWMSLLLVKMSEWPEGPKFFNPFLAKLGRFKAGGPAFVENSTKSSMINFWNHP